MSIQAGDDAATVREWLCSLGSQITLHLDQPSMLLQPVIRWGDIVIAGEPPSSGEVCAPCAH